MKNKEKKLKSILPKEKKALSAVVIMVIMVALVLAVVAVVFPIIKKTVGKKIAKTESCGINLIDKFSINSEYVCYDSSGGEFIFSINRGDIEIDSLLVGIETELEIFQYPITNDRDFSGESKPLYIYDGFNKTAKIGELVDLPPKKGSEIYIVQNISEEVVAIQIAPNINGEQCEVVDTLTNIVDCSLTTI